jgi:hypothetical protein
MIKDETLRINELRLPRPNVSHCETRLGPRNDVLYSVERLGDVKGGAE